MSNLEQRIREIKERVNKAAPAPWAPRLHWQEYSPGKISLVGAGPIYFIKDSHPTSPTWDKAKLDADFIAYSRSDIEFLVKALEISKLALENVVEHTKYSYHSDDYVDCFKILAENALKEVEELVK